MSSSIIAIIIAAITIVLFMWNKLPMSVVAMGSSVAMGILIPEMDLSAVYAGFSAPGWAMVVGMCIVSAALLKQELHRESVKRSVIPFWLRQREDLL